MSPAGYWPQLHAAIEAGADAVYFGLKHFSARAKVGFGLEELPEVMTTLHRRGVKGYVTFNTLVFEHEMAAAAESLAAIARTGADSIIVQDVGIAQLARRIAPDLAVHGSTQMSITSVEGIRLAQRFGVTRVVLARELALDEIRAIRAQTDCELEIFVHGALCVSYSGQCFSSEAWGGRSANRGQCAQACRLPYEMMVDGQMHPLGDARYLLSPGDLYALEQMPEIVQLGVSALKIEGRYKDADYVALTAQAYRQAVDAAWAGRPLPPSPAQKVQLEQVYSRGLGPHFINGVNHQSVVRGRAPRHRGVLVGQVTQVLADRIFMQPEAAAVPSPLKAGDGVVFDAADWRSPEEAEEGGRVYHARPTRRGQVEVEFGNRTVNFDRIRPGDLIWRTHDPVLDKVVRPFTEATSPVHKQPVALHVTAQEGQPLALTWSLVDQPRIQVTVYSSDPLPTAQNQAISEDFLREQLGRLGTSVYELAFLQVEIQGQPFAPTSLLNQLRREAVEALTARQSDPGSLIIHPPLPILHSALSASQPALAPVTDRASSGATSSGATSSGATSSGAAQSGPQLHLLVRTPEQLDGALSVQPASITLDYLDLYGLRPALAHCQAAGVPVRVAAPRILKPREQGIIHFLRRLGCPILVRSAGLLQALQGNDGLDGDPENELELVGDFSLNAANPLTAHTFLQMGLSRLTPTYDLNGAQVTALAQAMGPQRVEVVAYQHLPVFHTEHCVFCRFLSTGTSKENCGQPCERHQVALRDANGRAHPVLADVGCRNTVFGAQAQEASRYLDEWLATGITHFRLEFVHETGDEVIEIARLFGQALAGEIGGAELGRHLHRLTPQGTTEGSFFVPEGYLDIPLLQ